MTESEQSAIDISHFESLILIAGISGAGKSKALDVLADLGYFNLENLPVPLLRDFITFSRSAPGRFRKTVLLADIDSRDKLNEFMEFVSKLSPQKGKLHLIFMDCAKDTILKRYSETRRPHPSFDPARDKTLEDAIIRERQRLSPFLERANLLVDTTNLTIHDLKRELKGFCDSLSAEKDRTIRINFLSFGFKYGAPLDCDLVVDVRFLPNPYFMEHLREKDGREPEVASYVKTSPTCEEFLVRYTSLLEFLVPQYIFEGKYYLNIGVGCTGGKHRSVAVAEELSRRIHHEDYLISVKHRDAGR